MNVHPDFNSLKRRCDMLMADQASPSVVEYVAAATSYVQSGLEAADPMQRAYYYVAAEPFIDAAEYGNEIVRQMVEQAQPCWK